MLKKILLFSYAILLILLLTITIDRIRIIESLKSNLPNFEKTIEANFFNFKLESKSIGSKTQAILVAAQPKSKLNDLVFTANRATKDISVYKYGNKSVKLIQKFNFDTLVNKNNSNFLFDIELDKKRLLVSYVSIPQFYNSCDSFQIVEIPIQNDALEINKISSVWRSGVCVHSYPNNVTWHDFQGRMAISDQFIYLTAGLVIAATYDGYYPSKNFYGLNQDLQEQIKKNQLFGGVTQINKVTGKSSRFAEGFRGPSGITIREMGDKEEIFVSDHGPRGGDELNLIRKGGNYGWPWVSYGRDYFELRTNKPKGFIKTKFATHIGYDAPLYYWTPSIAPSQISVIKSDLDKYSSWAKGDLVLTTLKDKSIYRLKVINESIVSSERVFLGARIRDIAVTDTRIYVTTDDGRLMSLVVSDITTTDFAFPPITTDGLPFYYRLPILHQFSVLIDLSWAKADMVVRKIFK
jgi:hypothetical protein